MSVFSSSVCPFWVACLADSAFLRLKIVVVCCNAAVAWGSTKQNCVAQSSCEAEIIALSEAAKDMIYFRKLFGGIDKLFTPEPSPLATDNMAARDLPTTRSTTPAPSTWSGATSTSATW